MIIGLVWKLAKLGICFILLAIVIIVALSLFGLCVHRDICFYVDTDENKTSQKQLLDPDPRAKCWIDFQGVCVPRTYPCPFNQSSDIKPFNCSEDKRCCKTQAPTLEGLPKRSSCGQAVAPPKRFRVYNGWATVAWPWIVSIRKDSKHICGGTIISPSAVLSAAHCFIVSAEGTANLSGYSVATGEFNINKQDGTEKVFNISHVALMNYNYTTAWNDIIILTLHGKIEMDYHRQPACLPVPEDKFRFLKSTKSSDTDVCYVLGWGTTIEGRPSELQMAALPLLHPQKCKAMLDRFATTTERVFNTKLNICTHFISDYVVADTCEGDSGGPLFCKREDRIILAGITSWGVMKCGSRDKPGVFVNVLPYVSWIKRVVKDLPK